MSCLQGAKPDRLPGILFLAEHVDGPEAELIRRLHLSGYRVGLLTHPDRRFCAPLEAAGVLIRDLALRSRHDSDGIRVIAEMLDLGVWDILHFLQNRQLSNTLYALRGRPRVRTVVYRGAVHLSLRSRWLYRRSHVDRIVCVSEAIRRHMLKLGFPPEQLAMIHKGHPSDAYRPAPRAALGEWGIPDAAFVVGCAAKLRRGKGIDDLIRALGRIPPERNVWLLLAGEVSDRRLPGLARRSPAANRIRFAGPRPEAASLMGACDVFVMPTREREGLGKAPIEAMAQGVPAVVTDAGGLPEIVTDGVDGRVVPRGNPAALAGALMGMADLTKADRTAMGARAAETIRTRFHTDAMVCAYRRLYSELMRGS